MTCTVKPLALALALCFAGSAGAAAALDPASLDKTAGACTDFYGYVNNTWAAANPVPSDRTRWGTFDELREQSLAIQHKIVEDAAKDAKAKAGSNEKKLGDFYASGMDVAAIEKDGINALKPELARIDTLKKASDVADYVAHAHAEGNSQLFRFGGRADFKNSGMVIAYATQGGLGLPERGYYLEQKPDYERIRAAYVVHIAKVLELAGSKSAEATKQANWIMALETKLAEASLPPIELRDPNNQYHFVSVAEAEKATPGFSWSRFLAAQGLKDVKGFSLSQPKFFTEMNNLLAKTPVEHWQAYLRFHTVDDAAPYMNDAFVQENFNFYSNTLRGQKEIQTRWKRVLGTINGSMGMALGEIYVASNFPPESKQRAQELVKNLSLAYKARIENLDWMGAETKTKALEKWASFTPKIGYPDVWRDWSGLKVSRDSYLGNVLTAAKFDHDWRMAKIGKPVDRNEWGMTPQTVNAYYNAAQNEIVFPAAILQPPFFSATADDALNYGGIGAVIGHEMGHGYDDRGSQFDAKGNFNNWWTSDDRAAFTSRADKLVAQFDDYVVIDDVHVKGKLTLGENIADLGGMAVAYDALQMALKQHPEENHKIDGLSPEQRFFINWARVWRTNVLPEEARVLANTDSHSPGRYRAMGAPSNMDSFAEAFSCKPTDPMVRSGEKKVKIW